MTTTANMTGSAVVRLRPAALRREAARERIPGWLFDVAYWGPWVGFLALGVLFVVQRDLYYAVLSEDRPVEWLQFTGLLCTSAFSAMAAWRLRGKPFPALILLLLAVGSFVLAGEEISWAQRAFALEGPAALVEVNKQSELNVHNVMIAGLPIEALFKAASIMLAVGLLAMALLSGPRPKLAGSFWQTLSVPRACISGPLVSLVFWAAYLVLPIPPIMRFQEWAEASLYLSLGVAVYAIWARSRPASSPGGRQALVVLGIAGAITLVLAALSAYHGIIPLNNPERLG